MDYSKLASKSTIEQTSTSLSENNFQPIFVETKEDALNKIKEIIPEGVSIMNGASTTLDEIGFIDLLKGGNHKWNNLHDSILVETDELKKADLRKQAIHSDFYLGSAHAITEKGEIVVASNTGSQLAHLVFTSSNLVLVVGTQKIVPTLADAFKRIDECVVPLEDERMKGIYGMGTTHAKTVILHKENPMMGRKVHVILVNEKLGF